MSGYAEDFVVLFSVLHRYSMYLGTCPGVPVSGTEERQDCLSLSV